MNSGIRDAANISWKIAEVVRGRLGPLLLQSYEEERRDHVKSMIKLALRMGAIMGPSSRLHGLATRAFFRCLNIWPSARTYFAEMKYKPPPQFTNGFLVLGAQSAHGAVGRLLPQPPIADSTHGTIQLDDILEEGFVLLGVDVGADALAQTSLGPDWDQMLSQKLQLTSQEVPVFKRFRGKFLLLRPDRYIMASFQKGEEQNAVKALVLLRRQTWPMEDAR
jgi:3-(3-hydroxy-phenyl)propionate hydroxylase